MRKNFKLLLLSLLALGGGSKVCAEDWTDIENGDGLVFEESYGALKGTDVQEMWTATSGNYQFALKQEVTGIPNGVYELSVNAMYRASTEYGTETNCILYATTGGETYSTPICNFGDWTATDNLDGKGGMTTVMDLYDAYKNVMYVFVKDGSATIGMKSTDNLAYCTNGYWFVWKKSSFKFKQVTDTYLETLKTRANAMLKSAQNGEAKTALSDAVNSAIASVESIETLQAAIDEFLASASAENPIDVTSYMANPSFEEDSKTYWYQDFFTKFDQQNNRNVQRPNGWNLTYSSADVNNIAFQSFMPQTDGAKDGKCLYVRHKWDDVRAVERLHQIVKGLPQGTYEVTVSVKANDANNDPNTLSLTAGSVTNKITISNFPSDYQDYKVSVYKEAGLPLDICYGFDQQNTNANKERLYWIDDFRLTYLGSLTIEQAKEMLEAEINAIDTETNVGEKAFQIPTSAVTELNTAIEAAQGVYDDAQASIEDVKNAIAKLKAAEEAYANAELNAPDAEKPYTITLTEGNDNIKDHAVEFVKGGQTAAQGTYAIQYNRAYNVNLASQHFYFKAADAEGVNLYNIWFVDNDGEERYICDGTVTGAGTGAYGIRTTTDPANALVVKVIASETDGITYMINTKADDGKGRHLGSNGDRGMYSWEKLNENFYKNFRIEEAAKATIEGKLEAGKYATRIYPFVPEPIDGVKFYSCETVEGTTLVLNEVENPEANKPYILYNEKDAEIDIAASDYGTLYVPTVAGSNAPAPVVATTVTDGLLTGVYTEDKVGEGNYVLQTQGGEQAFYQIAEGSSLTAVPYRAYLTVPEGITAKSVYYFDFAGDATAIEAVPEAAEGAKVFYNLAGQRVANPTKGIYIVNGQKVLVK